jgi:hypothetical protein
MLSAHYIVCASNYAVCRSPLGQTLQPPLHIDNLLSVTTIHSVVVKKEIVVRVNQKQAIRLANELKAARVRLFECPSMRDRLDSEVPYPAAAERLFSKLLNQLVDHIPAIDLYTPGEGCPFCGAEDDHLVEDPEIANGVLHCEDCGHLLTHSPRSEEDKQDEEQLMIVHGVPPDLEEVLARIALYVEEDRCSDCKLKIEECQCDHSQPPNWSVDVVDITPQPIITCQTCGATWRRGENAGRCGCPPF